MLPNAVSLAAMASGFFSILMTLDERLLAASQLILLAMILDGLDGNLARGLNATSQFGAELDTYVDMTAFGVAPAILVYEKAVLSGYKMTGLLLSLAIVISGVIRLARFKAQDDFRGQKGYTGLPITISAGWVALLILLNFVAIFFVVTLLICLLLQVSNLRYPKPTKDPVHFSLCAVLILPLLLPNFGMVMPAAFVLSTLGFAYVILGPFAMKFWAPADRREKRPS